VRAHLDTDYSMISPDQDITLKKVGESEDQALPIGIYLVTFGDKAVFVRRFAGRFMPVSTKEQDELCQQFRL